MELSLAARGTVTVNVDGAPAARVTTAERTVQPLPLAAGDHVLEVRYSKPANTDPLVRVSGVTPLVTPWPVAEWRRAAFRPARVAARAVDLLALLTILFGVAVTLRAVAWSRMPVLAAALLALFVVQGIAEAVPLRDRAVSLSGGDDWHGFEARGRAVAFGDVLMLYGQPPGKGDVLFYHPGYIVWLAGVHLVGTEDFAGPVFLNFLLLFAATLAVYRLGLALFDRRIAIGALLLLVPIEEIAFMRHYTVTLLSENLFFPLIAFTVLALVRVAQTGSWPMAACAGLMAGAATLTRSPLTVYVFPALIAVAAAVRALHKRRVAIVPVVVLIAVCWAAVISLATIRNYIAAGVPVLINQGSLHGVLEVNLSGSADDRAYFEALFGHNDLAWTLGLIARAIIDHPRDMLRGYVAKLGFSFGWLSLMGQHFHPELVAVSVGYLLAVICCRAARAPATWPVHAFLVAYLLPLVMYIPSTYGYRLILPLYLFFPLFASALGVALVDRLASARAVHDRTPAGERSPS